MFRRHAVALALSILAVTPALAEIQVPEESRPFLSEIDGKRAILVNLTFNGVDDAMGWRTSIRFTPGLIHHPGPCHPATFPVFAHVEPTPIPALSGLQIVCESIRDPEAITQEFLGKADRMDIDWPNRLIIFSREGEKLITYKLDD